MSPRRFVASITFATSVLAVGVLAQSHAWRLVSARGLVKARVDRIGFIDGPALARLKDARTVRVALELSIAATQNAPPIAGAEGVFELSYDLWEERFAATLVGAAPRSASHLTPAGSEAWCLDQLAIPEASLGAQLRGTLFAQVTYIASDQDEFDSRQRDDSLSLRGLIDRLSRRGRDSEWRGSLRSGPIHLE